MTIAEYINNLKNTLPKNLSVCVDRYLEEILKGHSGLYWLSELWPALSTQDKCILDDLTRMIRRLDRVSAWGILV